MALEHAAEHQAGRRDGSVERIADQVVEVVRAQPVHAGDVDRMNQDEGAELGGRGPDRLELRIVEILAGDIRADLHAAQAERRHRMAKLVGGLLRRLHRDRGDRLEAAGMGLHQLGELLVLDAGERRRQRRRLAVQESLRADRQHLHVDLGGRHVPEAAIEVPAAARKVPVDVAGDVERAELLVDIAQFRRHLGRFPLQQPHRVFSQDMGVNIDRLWVHGSVAHGGQGRRRDWLRE